jgi:hypothetical protein
MQVFLLHPPLIKYLDKAARWQHELKVTLNDDRIKATAYNPRKIRGSGQLSPCAPQHSKGCRKVTVADSHHTKQEMRDDGVRSKLAFFGDQIMFSNQHQPYKYAGFTNARKETTGCRLVPACAAQHMQMEDKQKLLLLFASKKHII